MNELRRLRIANELTQTELAEKAGTSQPQIKRLENGERKLTVEWAERIAPHLGVTPQQLLFPANTGTTRRQEAKDHIREFIKNDVELQNIDLDKDLNPELVARILDAALSKSTRGNNNNQ